MRDYMDRWPDEKIATLKALWDDGLTASTIAARLGPDITRNMVIGKIHRLGLPPRAARTSAREPHKPRRTAPWQPKVEPTKATPRERKPAPQRILPPPRPDGDVVVPLSRRLTLEQLTDKTCKWPNGDPRASGFDFCGHDVFGTFVYCEHHCRIAYQAPGERDRRKRSIDRQTRALIDRALERGKASA